MASNNSSTSLASQEVDLRTTFKLHKSSLKTFLELNDVQDEEKKKGIFLLSLRKELEELLQRLCSQGELEEMSCAELLTRLERVLRSDDLLLQYTAADKHQEPTPSGSRDDCAAPVQDQRRTGRKLHRTRPMVCKDRLNKYQNQTVTKSTVGVMAQNSNVNLKNVVITTQIQERGQTAKNPLPYKLRNQLSTFRGREDYLDDLTATLDKPDCNVVVVHGFSGVGKSELCNQYAWRNIQRYQKNIVWIHAEHLEQELLDLARELDVNTRCTEVAQPSDRPMTQITKDVYSLLREKGVSLLVLDDVLTRDMINKFLPGDQHKDIRVLITSPYAYWEGVHKIIKLEPLTNDECENIFVEILKTNVDLKKQKQGLKNLLKFVGGYPLAVQICGAYISYESRPYKTNYNLNTYVDKLLENEKDFLKKSFLKTSEHEYDKTIYVSFKTTLDKIFEINENSKFTEILEILNVCAYLHAEAIPRSLLQDMCQTKDLPGAIQILEDFSLIVDEQNNHVRMDRIIQKSILLHQEKSEENSKWFQKVLIYFLACNERYEVQLASVLSHAQRYTQVVLDLFANQLYTSKLLLFLVTYDCYETVEHIFAQVKEVEKIKQLVRGSNLLHVAVRCNKRQMVETLLMYEDDLDRLDDEGLSPLLVAAARGLEDVAELLISRGARMCLSGDIVIEVGDGENPASATWTDESGHTLLHLAAYHGHVELCKHSLAAPGCDVNVTGESGYSPIHMAACRGHVHVLRCLLEVGGAAVDTPGGSDRHTALMLAAEEGHTEAVGYLLEHGASIQARDAVQWSALHYASCFGHADTVALLVAAPGCEVNALDVSGSSPLHVAAWQGHLDVVRVLCAAGARGDVLDRDGDTPLGLASPFGHTEVCAFLKEQFPGVEERRA